jgi:glycosyltransferase involved in cell wall biosynthesis
MRVLHTTSGIKWTGPAAVAIGQVAALREAGIEAEIAVAADSPLARRLAGEGWVRPLLAPGRRPRDFFRDVAALAETVAREPFDLVHTHGSHDHLIASAALGGSGPPLVRSFHHASGFRPLFSSWGRRRASGFAFSSSALADAFVTRFGRRAPCARFSPVVDLELFAPEPRRREILEEFGVPADAFVVGTIGKMAAGRGHDAAIRILSECREPNVVLFHVGKGERKEALWRLAAGLGVGARNFGAGYQEENLPSLYRAMDAFLFTASGADQGHRAILEAMASGLPVVALDLPGVSDFGIVKGPGFVARSEGEASAALDFLSSHGTERRAMAAAARLAAARFSGKEFAASAVRFYEEVLESGKIRDAGRVSAAGGNPR